MRLVAPESRYEIDDGRLVYVAPADEPHGNRHALTAAVVALHLRADYDVAVDMLTRTSETSDIAPDVSVYPRARDPGTGGRKLEELAFEIASTQSLADAGRKAHKLVERGVRRVFATDVARQRAFEWSSDLGSWAMLAPDAAIEDPVLAVPLPVAALVEAVSADDVAARALLAKRNPVIVGAVKDGEARGEVRGEARGEARARASAVLTVLEARGIAVGADERARVEAARDLDQLQQWLTRAATCASARELFA